ncbi:hypothetical protein OG806_21555 [Streptomyces sp. NBC_00882]|uniref:hypothetical protein n=1 Tax=Streptomyces sp. NBC_00882 TaxID=2975856 RepID=UPI003868ECC3|nr:hypothetical protein OG806_21555 [Streptomyces sp. NBC_00882]
MSAPSQVLGDEMDHGERGDAELSCYGAEIRESGVDWLVRQIRDMARIPASEDGDRVTGLFLASHEVDGTTEWQVRDGQLFVSPSDGRYRYLNA